MEKEQVHLNLPLEAALGGQVTEELVQESRIRSRKMIEGLLNNPGHAVLIQQGAPEKKNGKYNYKFLQVAMDSDPDNRLKIRIYSRMFVIKTKKPLTKDQVTSAIYNHMPIKGAEITLRRPNKAESANLQNMLNDARNYKEKLVA